MVSDKILDSVADRFLPLRLTYNSHAVACAAALAVLNIYENKRLNSNAERMGFYTNACMKKLIDKHPSIGDWRNTGILGCLELVKNRDTKEPMAPFNASPSEMSIMNKVVGELRVLGMFTCTRWNYMFVAPPLIANEGEIGEGMDIISKALLIADEYCY